MSRPHMDVTNHMKHYVTYKMPLMSSTKTEYSNYCNQNKTSSNAANLTLQPLHHNTKMKVREAGKISPIPLNRLLCSMENVQILCK